MAATLGYGRSTDSPRRLLPAVLLALVSAPALGVGAAVFGCSWALDSWPLSPANLSYSVSWGAVWGIVGGLLTVLIAAAFRRAAIRVSVVGSLVVAALSGASLFVYALMLAAV